MISYPRKLRLTFITFLFTFCVSSQVSAGPTSLVLEPVSASRLIDGGYESNPGTENAVVALPASADLGPLKPNRNKPENVSWLDIEIILNEKGTRGQALTQTTVRREDSENMVEPPDLGKETVLVILEESSVEDAFEMNLSGDYQAWIMSILKLEGIFNLDSIDQYKRYDAPDTDPVLNALEGVVVEAEMAREEVGKTDTTEIVIADEPEAVPDIPLYTNKRIEGFINFYTVRKRSVFELSLQRSAKYMGMINRIFAEYEIPSNLAYLAIVESNLNPNAISRAKAVGLWQFMSYTGKVFDLNRSWWHDDRYDPEKSTIAAARYLKQLHKRFNGDWELALAAYNSGGGTVRRAIRKNKQAGKPTDYWNLRLPRETRGYVPAFYAVATIYQDLEKYGFDPAPEWLPEVKKKSIAVPGGITLRQISKILKVDADALQALNPALRLRGLTPATYETFEISIPADIEVSEDYLAQIANLEVEREEDWKMHQVKQGETLWSISRYYNIPLNKILAFNTLKRKNLITIGQKLMLPVPRDWAPPPKIDHTEVAVDKLNQLPGITFVHVVKKGETLWLISNMYDIPIEQIRRWNSKTLNRRYLKVGAKLVLKIPIKLELASST